MRILTLIEHSGRTCRRLEFAHFCAAAIVAAPSFAAAEPYEGTCEISNDDESTFQEHIYFGVNGVRIAPDQMEKLRFAAQQAKALYAGQICLFASASKSGPADCNRKLALKRGRAVARELARHGVSKVDIVIEARGEAWASLKLGAKIDESAAERQVEIYFVH